MVQVPVNQIVHMVIKGYRGMAAIWSMYVICCMTGALVLWRAGVGVSRGDTNHMFIDMVPVRMVHMAIVQVVNMVFMPNSDVPAIGTMLVVMVVMVGLVARCHEDTPVS